MKKPERMEVFFEGRVQGVGFRYTTSSIAERFPITGRVRNLDDGRVHLVAEGARSSLDEFLDDIDEALGTYIHRQVVNWGEAREDWTDFAIER